MEHISLPQPINLPERLAASVGSRQYQDRVHTHLSSLLAIDLRHHGPWDVREHPTFDLRRYWGLDQTALESGPKEGEPTQEATDGVWTHVNQQVGRFDAWMDRVTGQDDRELTQLLDPYVRYMRHVVRNSALFQHFYGATTDPWTPLIEVLVRGILLDLRQGEGKPHPAFFARGQAKREGRYWLDDRYDVQQIVHAYLYDRAQGHSRAQSGAAILSYLQRDWGIGWDRVQRLQTQALVPLKKAGLIGSSSDGYFLLATPEDCNVTIRFHEGKARSINTVIEAARRAKETFEHRRPTSTTARRHA
jgi:hypothetical protein